MPHTRMKVPARYDDVRIGPGTKAARCRELEVGLVSPPSPLHIPLQPCRLRLNACGIGDLVCLVIDVLGLQVAYSIESSMGGSPGANTQPGRSMNRLGSWPSGVVFTFRKGFLHFRANCRSA